MKQAIQKMPLFVPFQQNIDEIKFKRAIEGALISFLIAVTVLAYFSNKHDRALLAAQQTACLASKPAHQ